MAKAQSLHRGGEAAVGFTPLAASHSVYQPPWPFSWCRSAASARKTRGTITILSRDDTAAIFSAAAGGHAGGYRLAPKLADHTSDAGKPLKRLADILGAATLLALAAPLMALIAAALWLTGTKSIFYRQKRAGAGGNLFHLLKFRTMTALDDAAFTQAVPGDARVTRLGRSLRKTSLDELPQLLNVLAGDMSLVGPRPHAPASIVAGLAFEDAVKFYRLRHRVKPGMTGLAQIRGQRGATGDILSLQKRVSSDLEYIETWSLRLDFLILLRTIPAVLRPTNAY